MKPGDLLTLAEAADLAGLSPTTLRVQIRNGKLKAVKRGRDWWVTRRSLLDYMTQVSRKTGSQKWWA
jgi:excisionase family DNA binding protein